MGRFKRYIAAFLLVVFVSGTVSSWTYEAKAQIPGLADVVAGVISGVGDLVNAGKDAAMLLEILSEIQAFGEQFKEKAEDFQRLSSFIQTSYYSVKSLAIIDYYIRDVSQFVSLLTTGKFYNFSSAVAYTRSAVNSGKELSSCFNTFRKFLDGKLGEATGSKQDALMNFYNQVVAAYKRYEEGKNTIMAENLEIHKEVFDRSVFLYTSYGDVQSLLEWNQNNDMINKVLSSGLFSVEFSIPVLGL